jgi:hypothetical protein
VLEAFAQGGVLLLLLRCCLMLLMQQWGSKLRDDHAVDNASC